MQANYQAQIAKAISYILNPLLMPTIGIFLIFYSGTYLSYIPQEGKNLILSIVFTGTFIVPLCFVPLYLYLKIIRNVEIEERSQRIIPYIITLVAFLCTFYLIRRIPIPFINSYILAICLSLFVNTLILLKWKISTHLIGAGGIVSLIIGLIFRMNADIVLLLILSILLSGILGYSRLVLKAHAPKEIYLGFFVGFSIVSAVMLIL
jgi:membrane-associated phospholipid phosphatase